MRTVAFRPLHAVAAAVAICVASVRLDAQVPGPRGMPQSAPPVPIVTKPAEGQVVSGDLEIAVQVQAGATGGKYSVEAAYWDSAQTRWVYPGALPAEFGGGAQPSARIAAATRGKYFAPATRWRIHVLSTDPPGSWGPWREFTWRGTDPSASAPGPASAPGVAAPTQAGLAAAGRKASIADLVAQIDKQIAAAKKQIVLLKVTIAEVQQRIPRLEADYEKTFSLLHDIAPEPGKDAEFMAKVKPLMAHLEQDLALIQESEDLIYKYRKQVNELEKTILDLQKQRYALLAQV